MREAARALERRAVDITEHDPTIDVGDPIVVVAEHAVGVRDANARFAAEKLQVREPPQLGRFRSETLIEQHKLVRQRSLRSRLGYSVFRRF